MVISIVCLIFVINPSLSLAYDIESTKHDSMIIRKLHDKVIE